MRKPRFISFEGGEGAGKSTQIKLLQQAFEARALPLVLTREPGGSPGAEAIRKLVVEGDVNRWHPTSEALLFMAARYDHLQQIIFPALERGKFVLCDRFYDSTYVYQGLAKEVGTDFLDQLYSLLYGNFAPDLTLYLDLAPEVGLLRTGNRKGSKETRFESMDMRFHHDIREGFLQRVSRESPRMQLVDASGDREATHAQIVCKVNEAFSLGLSPVL